MSLADLLLLALAAAAAFVLNGCGSGGSGKPKAVFRTTVIVMRHCVRSTDANGMDAKAGYVSFNNYSAQKWPLFSVPAMWCLPRGEQIVTGQGRWMRSQGGLPLPLRAIADDVPGGQRDNVTMYKFLEGLALADKDVSTSVDDAPFARGTSDACMQQRSSNAVEKQAMLDFMATNPPPPGYQKSLQQLFQVLGMGEAGNWTGIPCTAGSSPWGDLTMPAGACQAASEIVERMLMEWGGGMNIGWGRVTPSELMSMMVLHAWQFRSWFAFPGSYKWQGASIMRHISARLANPELGTTLYVGHDDTMMMLAGALGLSWDAAPFPENATLPGSMLRFDLEEDHVTASYHYVANFSEGTPDSTSVQSMLIAPALFSHASNLMSLAGFQELLEQGSFAACASSVSEQTIAPLTV